MGDTSPSARRGYSTEEKFFIIYQFTNKLPWSEIHKNFNERFPARRLICLQKENARLNRACPIIEDDGQLIFVSPGSTDTKVNEYNNLTRPLPAKKAKGVPLSSRYAEQLADGEFSWLSPEDLKEAHELAGLRRPLREAWESARAKERAQGKESLQAAWEIRIRNMFRALRTTDQWLVQRLARAKLEDDDKGRPFVCTWENCIGLKFDKKKQWVRHEHTSHRHLKTWNCNAHGCGYHSFRRSNFRDHLIRVHKFDKNNAYMQLNRCQSKAEIDPFRRAMPLLRRNLHKMEEANEPHGRTFDADQSASFELNGLRGGRGGDWPAGESRRRGICQHRSSQR